MINRALARRSVLLGGLGAALAASGFGPAFGQATGTRLGGPAVPPAKDPAIVSPLDAWVDIYGRPTARVMLNGKGPFEFLVDTGANITVLSARRALEIGAPLTGMATINGTTGSADMPMATVDRLATGVVNVDALSVAVLPDEALPKQDGILGADVFVGRRLAFEMQHRRVLVQASQRNAMSRISGVNSASMRVRNGRLAEIAGHIGRIGVRMMLDTGADNCIVNKALEGRLLKTFPRIARVEHATVVGVTGQVMTGTYLALPDIRFGGVTLRDAGAVAADAPIFDIWGLTETPAMIVGINVLSRLASFSIDYGAQTFEAIPLALLAEQGVRLI
ncbi:MAG: aspartyl protease family protein [Alphaproteobacteria bacterium]